MAAKKKVARKVPAKVEKDGRPKKAKAERGIIERDGVEYNAYFIPETEVEVPEGFASMLYPLDAISIDPSNPRNQRNIDVLIAGIKRFGMRVPIIVNSQTMEIEAGHQRYDALKRLGCNYAPMVFVNDSDITAAAFNISDNRTAEIVADWDEAALSRIFGVLQNEDALEGVGFDDQSIADLRMQLAETELEGMEGFGREHEERGKEMGKGRDSGKPKGDGNWFYVEYYGEESGKVFEELKGLIGDHMTTTHEIDPGFFADTLRKALK